jgi:predicted amino acid racemase
MAGEMSDWIILNTNDGGTMVQVAHIVRFRAVYRKEEITQEGSLVRLVGEPELYVRETPAQIAKLIGA